MIRVGRWRLTVWVLLAALVANGCASLASVTVTPARGQDTAQLERDRAECEAEAERERRPTAGFFATNIAAKVVGVLAGAMFGFFAVFASNTSVSSGEDARVMAGVVAGGAALGLVAGTILGHVTSIKTVRAEEQAYVDRYARCLGDRGYWVRPDAR